MVCDPIQIANIRLDFIAVCTHRHPMLTRVRKILALVFLIAISLMGSIANPVPTPTQRPLTPAIAGSRSNDPRPASLQKSITPALHPSRVYQQTPVTDQTDLNDSYNVCYDQLSADGHWLFAENYGYVYQPKIAENNPDWRLILTGIGRRQTAAGIGIPTSPLVGLLIIMDAGQTSTGPDGFGRPGPIGRQLGSHGESATTALSAGLLYRRTVLGLTMLYRSVVGAIRMPILDPGRFVFCRSARGSNQVMLGYSLRHLRTWNSSTRAATLPTFRRPKRRSATLVPVQT